jgi:O-antigen/teichoic acid export membrane protein
LIDKSSVLKLNIAATLANLLVSFIIAGILTPFLVSNLGPAHFGLIPLITAVVSYFGIFSQTVSAALNRNLTIAIQKRDRESAQRIYFTSIAAVGIIILILSVPLTVISLNMTSLVNVPAGSEVDSAILSLAISWTLLVSIASLPFQSVLFAKNKTHLLALSSTLQNIARLILTVGFVLLIAANIASVGVAIVLSTIASFVSFLFASFRVAPWLDPTRRAFDSVEFRGLFRLSADVFLMQLGTVALFSSELMAVNLLFGENLGGRYAAAVALAFMLRSAVVSLASLAAPIIIGNYARGDMNIVAQSTIQAMKWIAVAVALPAGFLAAAASQTLALWLGSDFSMLGSLLELQVLALALTSPIVPLYSVCLGARRIRIPAAAQVLCAVLFVSCAWVGSRVFNGPVALAGLFLGIYVGKELAFMIPYSAGCIRIRPLRFAGPIFHCLALFLVAYACTSALVGMWSAQSWIALVSIGMVVTVPYSVAAWLLATGDERAIAVSLVKGIRERW